MSANLIRQLEELSQRVTRLERQRTKRGVTNQKGAAEYINRSTEWLRQMERRGIGPLRYPNGDYPYDGLDEFLLARREMLPREAMADLPATQQNVGRERRGQAAGG
jgi:hypothetical protein